MSTNPVIYTSKKCIKSRLIKIFTKFASKQIDFVYMDGMSDTNVNKIISKSPISKLPLLQDGEFFLSGTMAIIKYILSSNTNSFLLLFGKDHKTMANNTMWADFVTYNIWPFEEEILSQIFGRNESHDGLFSTAIRDLMQVLIKIDKDLTFKTFLHDHQVSFADIVLAHALSNYFSLVLDEELRANIPHLTRWYQFVANIKEVSSVLGKPRLCRKQQKPAGPKSVGGVTKNTTTNTSSNTSAKTNANTNGNTNAKSQPKKKEEPIKQEEKKKTPLKDLPPSTLDLDSFKKEFLNTKEKKESLDKLFSNFDPQGYSFWFLHYNKAGDQGKIQWKTCNLKSNFLQKLEKFRRYAFAAHGVYGAEPNLEVEGVWMWRGTDVPQEIEEHDSYNLLTIKPLNLNNEADKKMIEDFWLNV